VYGGLPAKSHIQLTDVSSLDRYDHTRHGLHLNPRGNGESCITHC
jgi:hypothetical protein